jgi:molybdopterin/thiamine biosynthesis adenylyltransferase
MNHHLPKPPADALSDEERATYEWQMWSPGFGEEGQRRLKNSTVLISRCGGLGSVVAYELAAAGVGHLVIAHGGVVKHSDLNRQLLMTHDWLGKPRIQTIEHRLKDLNPRLKVTPIGENISDDNAGELVGLADVVVDAAPMFEERFAMNDQAVAQGKPMVECAMYDLEATITTIAPGGGPCLRCLVPEVPPAWKRRFPVFGAVSGTVGCMGAMEAVKLLAGLGEPLFGRMVRFNLREMRFRTVQTYPDPACGLCGAQSA